MLSVARALAAGPDLLILDEPFEGLSPAVVPAVAAGIAAVAARGCSILIAESAPRHVPAGASAVHRLERGEITGP
jgi:branched-chain amino acid transport system ATP-binding protein